MSDEDPKAGKKDTKGAKRPKRDPNQPTPKPARRSVLGSSLKLIVSGAVVLVVAFVTLYSVQIGRPPWAWSSEDKQGFVDYSKAQVDEARAQVESVDWAKLKDKITEKTRQLWEGAGAWEQKLDAKLAELRGGGAPAPSTTAQAGATSTATPPPQPAAVEPAPPSSLELGCDAFRAGIRHYKKSMNSQDELRAAKGKFREAYTHLEAAHAQAQQKGDQAQADEIEGYLQQCNIYLEDCSKRETLR